MITCIPFSIELIIAGIALIIAFVGLLIACRTIRYQIISIILVMFTEKAKECNGNLNADFSFPKEFPKISGVMFSIITAKQLFDMLVEKYKFWLPCKRKQYLIDMLFLQLHTSIRVRLKEKSIDTIENKTNESNEILDKQFQDAKKFLKHSIAKYL